MTAMSRASDSASSGSAIYQPADRVRVGHRWVQSGPRDLRRLPDGVESRPYSRFSVRPITPYIGAELDGVNLAAADDELVTEIHRALLEWKVLFFRDQHLTGLQHRDFARRWGELEAHPFLPAGEAPEVVLLAKGVDQPGFENEWHTDVTWTARPPMGSILHAREVPPVGGDTLWADLGNAYDCLPDEIKERIDGLEAIHDFGPTFGAAISPERFAAMREEYPPVRHPVVRTHPETGRRMLFVNTVFTVEIADVEPAEGAKLLDILLAQVRVPEFQCRFRWTQGSVAFWDNRATQHYAVSDYYPERRVMERVTVLGERPY